MAKSKLTISHRRPPPPYDRGWAWLIVVGAFINSFIMMGSMKSFGLILEALVEKFNVQVAVAAFPESVAGISYAVATPVMLMLSEKFSIRQVVIFGGVISFIGISLSSLLFNIEYFTIFYGASRGLGYASFYANGLVMIGYYFRNRLSLATGMALSGTSIGQFVMPLVIEFLMENFAFGGTVAVLAGIHLNAAVAGMLYRPISQYGPDPEEEGEGEKEEGETKALVDDARATNGAGTEKLDEKKDERGLDKEDSDKKLLSDTPDITFTRNTEESETDEVKIKAKEISDAEEKVRRSKKRECFSAMVTTFQSHVTQFYTVVSALVFIGHINFSMFLPPIITERGYVAYDKALLISFCGIGDLISRLGTGVLADLKFIERYKLQVIAAILGGANIFMAIYADTFAWMAVHYMAYGMFSGSFEATISVVLTDFVGRDMVSRNLAVLLPVHGIGAAVTQILMGHIKDVTGSYDIVILICSLSMVLGGFLFLLYPVVRRLENRRLARNAGRGEEKTEV